MAEKVGDLRVWHVPQLPMKAFHIPVKDLEQAKLVMDTLAYYDIFQYENRIKGDYANSQGVQVYVKDSYGEGNPGWEDWFLDYDGALYEFDDFIEACQEDKDFYEKDEYIRSILQNTDEISLELFGV
jgi:hypothetical protein